MIIGNTVTTRHVKTTKKALDDPPENKGLPMPMIPDDELERIKRGTDLAAVVRSRGVALKPQGGDLLGLCPFHEDKNPSLHVTAAPNQRGQAASC